MQGWFHGHGIYYTIDGMKFEGKSLVSDIPRHRGLGEERLTFFRKGARSNPAVNSRNWPSSHKIETQS